MSKMQYLAASFVVGLVVLGGCNSADTATAPAANDKPATQSAAPEYFLLRPKLEKEYGYSHAVKIGDHLKNPVP